MDLNGSFSRHIRRGQSYSVALIWRSALAHRACLRENNEITHVVDEPSALMLCITLNFIRIVGMREQCVNVSF